MAITSKMYGKSLEHAFKGEINWPSDTIKVMLCTSSYVPNQDTHEFKSSVTNEVTGTGYTAGGATLGSKAFLTYDTTNNRTALDAGDVTWASSSITARYAVVYKDTGTAATSILLGYIDFGQDEVSSSGNFTIAWNSGGIFTVSAS